MPINKINTVQAGKKFDQDKVRLDLVEPDFIIGIAKVLTKGAEKYEPESWKTVPDAKNRYYAAALRHLLAWRNGEEIDPEWNLPHMFHLACNIMFLHYLDKEHNDERASNV
jgi:hypothetical protein